MNWVYGALFYIFKTSSDGKLLKGNLHLSLFFFYSKHWATFYSSTTPGDVKLLKDKQFTFFPSKHLSVPNSFHVINPFIKRTFIHVNCTSILCVCVYVCVFLYNVFVSRHVVNYLGPKLSVHAVSIFRWGNKAKSIVARSGLYGGRSATRAQVFYISIFKPLIHIINLFVINIAAL